MLVLNNRILLAAVLGLLTGFPTASEAVVVSDQANPRIMLVLDGSSSMWARVGDDVSKIEIAKDAIGDLVDGWEANIQFGITTYGHREQANCQDIETILPLADLDAKQVIEAVDSIVPRGKTPLSAALRQAAESLDYKHYPAKILLVSDGIENCGQDPCQAAAELAANAKNLSIDIIGFDVNNHQMGQLECIATNGNGHIVRSAIEDFLEAMDQTMAAAIERKAPSAILSLSTTLLGQTLTQGVHYRIYRSGDDDALTKIAETFLATPSLKLPAGKFVVEAVQGDDDLDFGNATEIKLAEGEEVQHVFDFDDFQPLAKKDSR